MAELFDIVVRRQIYIEGLKSAKGVELARSIAELRNQLSKRLEAYEFDDLGEATKKSLRQLIVDLRAIAKTVFDPYLKALIEWLKRFVGIDRNLLIETFSVAEPTKTDKLEEADSDEDMWASAWRLPMAATGTLALPFLLANLPYLFVKFERLAMQNFVNRSSKKELIASIVGTKGNKFNDGLLRTFNLQVNAATNTVLQHLANQSNANIGALILGAYEWISVLDDRTTRICRDRDGKRFPYGLGPLPPAHPNCRSTTMPCRLDDPKTIDSFSAWLRSQPDSFVNDALDGRRTARYERSSPITLTAYAGKGKLIVA